jgi:bacterioferritin
MFLPVPGSSLRMQWVPRASAGFLALIIARQIDYLGKMPVTTPKPVKTSEDPKEMLRADLKNEVETIRNYRERVRQCEQLGEYAMAEQIRQILVNEQDHQIDLATALGEDVPVA